MAMKQTAVYAGLQKLMSGLGYVPANHPKDGHWTISDHESWVALAGRINMHAYAAGREVPLDLEFLKTLRVDSLEDWADHAQSALQWAQLVDTGESLPEESQEASDADAEEGSEEEDVEGDDEPALDEQVALEASSEEPVAEKPAPEVAAEETVESVVEDVVDETVETPEEPVAEVAESDTEEPVVEDTVEEEPAE